MKGQTDLMTFLLKLFSVGMIVTMIVGIIFSLMAYTITIGEAEIEKELLILGDNLLAADCITVESGGYPVKGLLDFNKIDAMGNIITCFDIDRDNNNKQDYHLKIYDVNTIKTFGDSDILLNDDHLTSTFPAALKYADDDIRPVLVDMSMVL